MKQLIIIFIICSIGLANGQSKFEMGMEKAIELWKANKSEDAVNLFERIAKAEKNNWLPHYYIAQINSIKSWNVKDLTVLKLQLDKAQKHLDIAKGLSPSNAELLVMQAQVYTNWISFDGRTYGIKYASKVSELYSKAYTLEPKNPRVSFCKAEWEIGSAKYFGKDTAPFCKDIKESITLFDAYTAKSKIHPSWGKQRALDTVKECK